VKSTTTFAVAGEKKVTARFQQKKEKKLNIPPKRGRGFCAGCRYSCPGREGTIKKKEKRELPDEQKREKPSSNTEGEWRLVGEKGWKSGEKKKSCAGEEVTTDTKRIKGEKKGPDPEIARDVCPAKKGWDTEGKEGGSRKEYDPTSFKEGLF